MDGNSPNNALKILEGAQQLRIVFVAEVVGICFGSQKCTPRLDGQATQFVRCESIELGVEDGLRKAKKGLDVREDYRFIDKPRTRRGVADARNGRWEMGDGRWGDWHWDGIRHERFRTCCSPNFEPRIPAAPTLRASAVPSLRSSVAPQYRVFG